MRKTAACRIATAVVAAVVTWPGTAANAQDLIAAQTEGDVRGAHEAVRNPERTFTDDLDLTVPGTPIDHPIRVYPATDDFPTGPAIGERLPDFALANQRGALIDFHSDRAGRKAVVAFIRSAVW